MKTLSFFFSPAGRISGVAFFGGVLVIAAVEILAGLTREPVVMLAAALAAVFSLFCLFAKRLRDMGMSAWPAGLFAAAEAAVAWLAFSYLTSPDARMVLPWEPDKVLAMRELGGVGMLLAFVVVVCFLWGVLGPRNERAASGSAA